MSSNFKDSLIRFYIHMLISTVTKLSLEDYIKVNYHIFFSRWQIKGIIGLGIFQMVLCLPMLLTGNFSCFFLSIGLFFTMGPRAFVYFTAKGTFTSDARASERLEYEFDHQEIKIKGESFSTNLTWEKVYKVTETKDWFLIWHNRIIANVVFKRGFMENDLSAFKTLVKSQSRLKHNLS
jgi:hypothetical protein